MAKKKTVVAVEQADVADIVAEPSDELTVTVFPDDVAFRLIVAQDGDSYPVLAARYANGRSVRELARELYELNLGAPVRAGATVKVK